MIVHIGEWEFSVWLYQIKLRRDLKAWSLDCWLPAHKRSKRMVLSVHVKTLPNQIASAAPGGGSASTATTGTAFTATAPATATVRLLSSFWKPVTRKFSSFTSFARDQLHISGIWYTEWPPWLFSSYAVSNLLTSADIPHALRIQSQKAVTVLSTCKPKALNGRERKQDSSVSSWAKHHDKLRSHFHVFWKITKIKVMLRQKPPDLVLQAWQQKKASSRCIFAKLIWIFGLESKISGSCSARCSDWLAATNSDQKKRTIPPPISS